MATAKKITIDPQSEPETVTLNLTDTEAKIILELVGRVNGVGPARRATDSIYCALNRVVPGTGPKLLKINLIETVE